MDLEQHDKFNYHFQMFMTDSALSSKTSSQIEMLYNVEFQTKYNMTRKNTIVKNTRVTKQTFHQLKLQILLNNLIQGNISKSLHLLKLSITKV